MSTCVMIRNPGCRFDLDWIDKTVVNLPAVKDRVQNLLCRRSLKGEWQAAWQLKAITCIDLTTLAGDDTPLSVGRLCHKAVHPLRDDILDQLGFQGKAKTAFTTAAVCVYPSRVANCVQMLKKLGADIPVASVATGFPSGQYHLETRLAEIKAVVADGAKEVDVVINRPFALIGNWEDLYNEVTQMRAACGDAHLKTILAVGELGSLTNVYKASLVCMMAGADVIKTSTGKESVNATLPVGLVMARAIRDYHQRTGYRVGFKPAGGIRTAKDALNWQILMKEELGNRWLEQDLFRIGASGLLGDIEKQLSFFITGEVPIDSEFAMA